MRLYITADGGPGYPRETIAIRTEAGEWIDPYGGTFKARDVEDFEAFATGAIDAVRLGINGARLQMKGGAN